MNVVLGVCGGIAAYKAAELTRELRKRGHAVRVILTAHAKAFVGPLTFSVLSENPVHEDEFTAAAPSVQHIDLARWADVLVVAPATANTVGKFAHGLADDFLSTFFLAHRGRPVLLAPAMNTFMLSNPAVQSNLRTLVGRGVSLIEPGEGPLACGDEGLGRLAEVGEIASAVERLGIRAGSLSGKRVLVTAGPTHEPIDPVRFIGNRSSGKMGLALAAEASARGAEVTLVAGPGVVLNGRNERLVRVSTAEDMLREVLAYAANADILVMAAAVADFRPRVAAAKKIHRHGPAVPVLDLEPTPDILAAVSRLARIPFVVAFAAETENLEEGARRKLEAKGCDLLVANDVSRRDIGFESDENEVLVLAPGGWRQKLSRASKPEIAARLWDVIAARLESR